MQLLLLRHGETHWNRERRCQGITDIHLNETGRQQAKQMAVTLRIEKIDAVYSSHLQRAVQTARAISEPHGLEVTTNRDFRELNHGELEGFTFAEIRASYGAFIEDWQKRPAELLIPGGERLTDVDKRAWRGLEQIVRSHRPDDQVVVVSHHFPLVSILCRVTGTPLNQYRSFHLAPCGLVRISHDNAQGWRFLESNDPAKNKTETP